MIYYITNSAEETRLAGVKLAVRLAAELSGGAAAVVALYGDMGAGKTAFVRGMADGLGICAEVSSPTFAIVHDYGGNPRLIHFDMYRVESWDDLDSAGYYEYLDGGGILAVEWAQNIEGALPEDAVRVTIERLDDTQRRITIAD